MNKIKLTVLAISALALAGCGNGAAQNQQSPQNQQAPIGGNIPPVTQNNGDTNVPGNSGVISSIKDAMGLGRPMKCTYALKNKDGNLETVTYVDGKKYKSQMTIAGKMTNMIFDENALYTWSDSMKQGMKMTVDCMKDLNQNKPATSPEAGSPVSDPTGEKTFDNAMDVKCEEASGVDFSIPTDVTFGDQCAMLKGMINKVPSNIPGGVTLPKGVNIPNVPAQ